MQIKKKMVDIAQYSAKCPICGKEIPGWSESAVEYNLKLHIESHNKKEEVVKKA